MAPTDGKVSKPERR